MSRTWNTSSQYANKKKGYICQFCEEFGWIGPEMTCVPKPYPSTDGMDYLPYDKTLGAEKGEPRKPNDYQTRKRPKSQFQEDFISSNKLTYIVQFSQEYCVSETLVREALSDIELTKLKADQRRTNKVI